MKACSRCLMRLVFLLYAEDRDLLPSSTDPHLKQLWENGYSIKTLYARLLGRRGAEPRYDGRAPRRLGPAARRVPADPWRAPGLGDGARRQVVRSRRLSVPGRPRRAAAGSRTRRCCPVSDGTILRILHGLMTIEGRSLSGEKIRERLSYRSLDVESIGSVYETVMGFTARRATERMIALRDEKKLPNFIGLDALLAQKPNDRQKWLKELRHQALGQAGQGRQGGERCRRADRGVRLAGRRARLAQGDADRTRRALSAADRGAPPLRLALHAALADRADRAPCAGAGLRAARRQRLAGGGAVAEGARSRLRLRRLPGRSLPPDRRAAGAGLEHVRRGKAEDPARRGRGAACEAPRRAEMPLRRRPQSDGGRSRPPLAVARHAGARS